jgi:hypothetical protein
MKMFTKILSVYCIASSAVAFCAGLLFFRAACFAFQNGTGYGDSAIPNYAMWWGGLVAMGLSLPTFVYSVLTIKGVLNK